MNVSTQPAQLRRRVVGPWSLNSYAVVCPHTGSSLLIDPGDEPRKLAAMIARSRVQSIVVTHGHPDHIGALDQMRTLLDVPVMAFCKDRLPQVSRVLRHGDFIPFGRHRLKVYHAPGHTPDQICLGIEGDTRYFVGDTLFKGGPGKTWSAKEFKQSLVTLRRIVLAWPDGAVCFPGHGPSFRLDDIRGAIEAFLARDHGDFFGDALWGE
jgi:glyoxylase-like metal-dependent hydrolase (beta-lactamase superfamily II)